MTHEEADRRWAVPGDRRAGCWRCYCRPPVRAGGRRRPVALTLVLRASVGDWSITREPAPRPAPTTPGNALRRWLSEPRHDLVVGLHPGGLGPASAADAGATVRASPPVRSKAKDPEGISGDRPHAVRRRTVGMGRSGTTSRASGPHGPGPAARPSTRSCEGWSRYDAAVSTAGGDDHSPLRGGARRDRARGGGEARALTLILTACWRAATS